jgi:hypothetical protein
MGKGIIRANKGAGLYSVEIVYNTARVEAQITKLTARAAKFSARITALDAELALLLSALAADSGNDVLRSQVILARRDLNILKLQRTSALKYIEYLSDNTPPNRTIDIWCADLVEDLPIGQSVGLSEVPNEYGRSNIVPAYFNAHPYDPVKHGYLTPAVSMLPTSCYFNRSLFPAWQKWRVRYRYGEITAIDYDADTCSVSLDQATSSAQSLNVNNVTALSNIPIVYMQCNAVAFSVGDHVQVTCSGHQWQDATVTGFYSNPKPCSTYFVYLEFGAGNKFGMAWDILQNRVAAGPAEVIDGNGNPTGALDYWFATVYRTTADLYEELLCGSDKPSYPAASCGQTSTKSSVDPSACPDGGVNAYYAEHTFSDCSTGGGGDGIYKGEMWGLYDTSVASRRMIARNASGYEWLFRHQEEFYDLQTKHYIDGILYTAWEYTMEFNSSFEQMPPFSGRREVDYELLYNWYPNYAPKFPPLDTRYSGDHIKILNRLGQFNLNAMSHAVMLAASEDGVRPTRDQIQVHAGAVAGINGITYSPGDMERNPDLESSIKDLIEIAWAQGVYPGLYLLDMEMVLYEQA